MTEDQIKHMVDRFLFWKLPPDFTPDCGISFEPMARGFTGDFRREPIGTNLLTAEQAMAMVRHMVEGWEDEEVSAEIVALRKERDATVAAALERAEFAEAQLKGTNANISGWLAARDAQMERANLAERQLDESLSGHRQKAEAFDAIRLLAGQGMDDRNLERTAAGYLQRISVIADRRALAADHAALNAPEGE